MSSHPPFRRLQPQPAMDEASLIARIDRLLKSSPPPPDAVLKKIANVLASARGGASATTTSVTSPLSSLSEDLLRSSASSTLTESQRSTFTESQRSQQQQSQRRRTPSTVLEAAHRAKAAMPTAGDDDEPQLGMSLPLRGEPDAVQARVLARHAEYSRKLVRPADIRERQTRQYQALLEGRGGKYVHADYVNNGATQIGGVTSCTPSMTGGSTEGQMGRVASRLAAGGVPRIRNLPSDFRVA